MAELFGGEELVGEVYTVRYTDDSTGFGVIELDPEDGSELARCVGPLADLVEGQSVRLVGRHTEHEKYGPTFDAVFYEQVTPTTVAGMKAFLLSERFEGVPTPAITRVISTFGTRVGDVIERESGRLVSEAGLDEDVADRFVEAWSAGQAFARLHRLLAAAKVPSDIVRATHGHFGARADEVLRDDPYRLLEVERAGFAHADALGRTLGIGPTDERRLAAGAQAAVTAARQRDGHQFVDRATCIAAASSLLQVDAVAAAAGLERALAAGSLAQDTVVSARSDGELTQVVSTPAALRTEQQLAMGLSRLASASGRLSAGLDPGRMDDALEDLDSDLTTGQRDAIRAALSHTVSVLTGGPGTGKTRTIAELVRVASDLDANIALCAPTGRAAKRIEELVGFPATTIHRMLEARPLPGGGFTFRYGSDERLPYDLIVADEMSMADTSLARSLVRAIDDGTHLVIVGDPDQLPSVGPGDVLRDLLRSQVLPATQLTEVHRQAADSRIVALANAVNAGDAPELPGVDADVFMAEEPRRAQIVDRVVEAVAERAPAYFGVTTDDIQVVAPMYRGPCGVDALNTALKARLNPPTKGGEIAGFQEGDRVMQTRNDADLDVANGDVGQVVDVDLGRKRLRVAFPRGEVVYKKDQARDLTLAWAVTVHKSQGGEWPVVVLVCDTSHRAMLWRNLLYTAITRASQALIIVGQRAALRTAAAHDRPSNRHTALAWRLRQELSADDGSLNG